MYFPVALNLMGKRCTVIGGGQVARRKIEKVLDYGPDLIVISPTLVPPLHELLAAGAFRWEARAYQYGDLEGCFIAIAATGDPQVNKQVAREAHERGIPVNVADNPEESTLIIPAFFERGSLTISISTGGKSPALARRLRTELERLYGPEYGILADLLGEMRGKVQERIPSQKEREKVFREFLNQRFLDKIRQGNIDNTRQDMLDYLNKATRH